MFVSSDVCPSCKNNSFTNNWQGRLYVTDVENSIIAENVGIKVKGEYAIKIR